jgi:hypothetical protein
VLAGVEQVGEQRAVVHHRAPQLLGGGLLTLVELGDLVRRAVLLDDGGVVDRDVARHLLEVPGRVAALLHHALDQAAGVGDGLAGPVDERLLGGAPVRGEGVAPGRVQRADVELVAAVGALLQLALGVTLAAAAVQGAVVLRAEPLAQPPAPALPGQQQADHRQRDEHREHDQDDLGGVHGGSPVGRGAHRIGAGGQAYPPALPGTCP